MLRRREEVNAKEMTDGFMMSALPMQPWVRRGVFLSSQALNHFAAIGLMSQIQKAVKRLKDIHR